MEPLVEVGVVYKGTKIETFPNKKGEQVSMKVGVYQFFVKYPNRLDKAGEISLNEDTISNFTASKNNKFFFAISLDFRRNKGVFSVRSFDEFNDLKVTKPLSVMTNGNVFVNRGFQMITGDSAHPNSTIQFRNNRGKLIKFHQSAQPTKQSS